LKLGIERLQFLAGLLDFFHAKAVLHPLELRFGHIDRGFRSRFFFFSRTIR